MLNDQQKLKKNNLKLVLDIITKKEAITRSEIAEKSGLSLMSISKMVDYLCNMGIVSVQDNKHQNRYGRKAELVAICHNSRYFLIIDLTRYNIIYTVLDLSFNILLPHTVCKYDNNVSYNENLSENLGKIKTDIKKLGLDEKIIGIGLCVPGPYLVEDDRCINNRITEMSGVKLKKKLRYFFDYEIMFIDEDVKLAAAANIYNLDEIKNKVIMYIYIGEGVGGSLISDGKAIRGLNGVTGDIGQLIYEGKNFENHISLPAFYRKLTGKEADIFRFDENEIIDEILYIKNNDRVKFESELKILYDIISMLFYNIYWAADPHIYIIECEYTVKIDENFPLILNEYFDSKCKNNLPKKPEFIYNSRNTKDCYRGAAIQILYKWMEKYKH